METKTDTIRPATPVMGGQDAGAGRLEGRHGTSRPNPEVVARAKRRRFTAEYKRKILALADMAKAEGNLGALLRREGLYSSLLVTWRREREAGILEGLAPQKRGPKAKADPLAAEYQKLQRENERLTEQLRKAQIVIEVQKKVAALLGRLLPETETL